MANVFYLITLTYSDPYGWDRMERQRVKAGDVMEARRIATRDLIARDDRITRIQVTDADISEVI